MSFDYDENIELTPAILSMMALLPEGLESLSPAVYRAMERDDYSAALAAANKAYAAGGAQDLVAVLTYTILLIGREIIDEAMGILRRALKYHEHELSLQLAQTEALVVQGNHEAALQLMEALRSVSNMEPRHWNFLGDMYLDLAEETQAIECYENAIEKGSQDVEMAFRLAHLYLEHDNIDKATHYIEHAARLAPDNAMIWETAGDILLQIADFERAIYAYKRVLKLDADNARTWLYLGIAYQEADDFKHAAEAYEKVTKLEPDNIFGWLQLGHTQLLSGYPEKALQTYVYILRLEPENIEAINSAVEAAYELGDIELAGKYAREAVSQQPDVPETQYNWGVILQALHRPQEAEDPLINALSSQPSEPRYVAAWALNLVLLDKIEEGSEEILRASELGADAEELLAVVEELIKRGHFELTLQLLEQLQSHEATWTVVAPLFEFLCSALQGRELESLEDVFARFEDAVKAHPETIPVMWDFDDLDRMGLLLNEEKRKRYEFMVGVLEGRKQL